MKKLCVILLTTVLLCMTGCTTELYQQMLIKGFGIDKEKDGYKVTVRYAALNEQDKEEQQVVTGSTVYEALNSLSLTTGKKQMYSSAGYVIFGRTVASDGLDKALDFFVRYFKSGPTVNLYIADGTAGEILETQKDDQLISSDVIKAFTENEENKGKTVSATALSFISDVKREGSDAVIPFIEKQADTLVCTRSAVFSNYKMVGELSESATAGYLAGKGRLKNDGIVVEDSRGNRMTVKLIKTSAKTRHNMEGGVPRFTVEIQAEAVLSSLPLSDGQANFGEIEECVSNKIYSDLQEALAVSQKHKTDFLGFGYVLYAKETKFWKTARDAWRGGLPELPVAIEVTTNVISIGEEDTPQNSL